MAGSLSPRASKEVFDMSLDERLALTSTPLTADSKGDIKDMLFATGTYGGNVRRSSRRSSDILNATKQLDDGRPVSSHMSRTHSHVLRHVCMDFVSLYR